MGKLYKIPVLKGNRVTLRPIDLKKDSFNWYKIMKDPQMHLWTGNKVLSTINEAEDLLQKYKDNDEVLSWSIIRNENNEMIGTYWIAIPFRSEHKVIITVEAQRVAREFWRKGYTFEARKLIYKYVFL